MAIIIPSTKIYNVQNPKVRDNNFDAIELKARYGSQKVEKDAEKSVDLSVVPTTTAYKERKFVELHPSSRGMLSVYYNWFQNSFAEGRIEVPIKDLTSFLDVNLGSFKVDNYSVSYQKKETVSAVDKNATVNAYIVGVSNPDNGEQVQNSFVVNADSITATFNDSQIKNENDLSKLIALSDSDIYEGDLDTAMYFNTELDEKGNLWLSYRILVKSERAINFNLAKDIGILAVGQRYDFVLQGNYAVCEPISASLTINGTLYTIDLVEKTIRVGSENPENVFSIDGNEFTQVNERLIGIQVNAYPVGNSYSSGTLYHKELFCPRGEIKLPQEIIGLTANITIDQFLREENGGRIYRMTSTAEKALNEIAQISLTASVKSSAIAENYRDTLNAYKNGKENATIKCSIGEYRDDKGNLVISTKNSTLPMFFNLYDKVIPYTRNAQGEEQPLSTYQDGSPKVFSVLGKNIYSNGVVWQELLLQEI